MEVSLAPHTVSPCNPCSRRRPSCRAAGAVSRVSHVKTSRTPPLSIIEKIKFCNDLDERISHFLRRKPFVRRTLRVRGCKIGRVNDWILGKCRLPSSKSATSSLGGERLAETHGRDNPLRRQRKTLGLVRLAVDTPPSIGINCPACSRLVHAFRRPRLMASFQRNSLLTNVLRPGPADGTGQMPAAARRW
jgi:hypothetical protein